jgi:hypothetical protein
MIRKRIEHEYDIALRGDVSLRTKSFFRQAEVVFLDALEELDAPFGPSRSWPRAAPAAMAKYAAAQIQSTWVATTPQIDFKMTTVVSRPKVRAGAGHKVPHRLRRKS